MRPTRRLTRLIERFFPSRMNLAKLTQYPVFREIINKMLFEKNDLTYLTKDNVVEIKLHKDIDTFEQIALPSTVVHHFIDQSNYHFIMDFCICREAMDCSNYPTELGCLFMGEAARKIPSELGRPVSKKEAHEHVQQCREKGLVHLIGRDKLDETWLGVGSTIPLLTVCNCCECCCLWRMRPNLDKSLSSTIKRMPGIQIKINEVCTGCGRCTEGICFTNGISIQNNKAVISDDCVVCGRCAELCPVDAIEIIIKDPDFINKTIKRVKQATTNHQNKLTENEGIE